ncbi:MAG: ImmA/IrrE family metallo-endopeptidase, partial [Candidatus Omnitrophica bacterium]|nr:ImmA/IrrE family metallo-endopeptidase [Candidatus Omnitrophota bacterium]
KSSVYKESNESTAAWLRIAELRADQIDTIPFDDGEFKNCLNEIRDLSNKPAAVFEPIMRKKCSQAGVALVFVPELERTHLCGVTQWLTQKKAMIALSLRYKMNDHFWFTFFHEAAHILLHGKKEIFLDLKDSDGANKESQANAFAANHLIPEKEYKFFITSHKNIFKNDIIIFSKNIGVHPGIVVGRLQHDKYIKHQWHNDLKTKFDFVPHYNNL